jgi:cytosine/adenosine deaminase-related metal-dependent hydrolase
MPPQVRARKNIQADEKTDDVYFAQFLVEFARSEELTPTHNPITPVDEMLPHDLVVGIGSDNIADIWMPFNNADMWLDLRVLFEAARIHDLDVITDIATVNGRKILGIE